LAVGAPGWEIVESRDPARVLAVRAVAMWAEQARGGGVPQIEALLAEADV
jgi:hypothetical protein